MTTELKMAIVSADGHLQPALPDGGRKFMSHGPIGNLFQSTTSNLSRTAFSTGAIIAGLSFEENGRYEVKAAIGQAEGPTQRSL